MTPASPAHGRLEICQRCVRKHMPPLAWDTLCALCSHSWTLFWIKGESSYWIRKTVHVVQTVLIMLYCHNSCPWMNNLVFDRAFPPSFLVQQSTLRTGLSFHNVSIIERKDMCWYRCRLACREWLGRTGQHAYCHWVISERSLRTYMVNDCV